MAWRDLLSRILPRKKTTSPQASSKAPTPTKLIPPIPDSLRTQQPEDKEALELRIDLGYKSLLGQRAREPDNIPLRYAVGILWIYFHKAGRKAFERVPIKPVVFTGELAEEANVYFKPPRDIGRVTYTEAKGEAFAGYDPFYDWKKQESKPSQPTPSKK
jgi:hypothetical protein